MKAFFDRFDQLNVLIIGDIMMDTYLWGSADRISPEAPVPVVSVRKKESRLGGAGNVALNVLALGAKPILCAIAGNDTEGDDLVQLLNDQSLDTRGIIRTPNRPTTVKTRIIAHNQQILRVDHENDHPVEDELADKLIGTIRNILAEQKIDAIIFEDYDKGVISEQIITETSALARSKNIPTIVDPKKRNFFLYNGVTLFKPNMKELKDGMNVDLDNRNIHEVGAVASDLKERLGAEYLMVTLSEKGVLLIGKNEPKLIPAHIRDIADVSGAGDTVIATTAVCMAAGMPVEDVAAVANLAGGLVCELVGVVPVNKDNLLAEALKL